MTDERPNGEGPAIEAYYLERRTFPPPDQFVNGAVIRDDLIYKEAEEDWQGFWARQAQDLLDWFEPWETVCEWNLPFAKWFVGGTLNVSYNWLERHLAAGPGAPHAHHLRG